MVAIALALLTATTAAAPPIVAPSAEARGEMSREAAETLFKKSKSGRVRKKRLLELVAASDAYPNNPSFAAAAALALFEGRKHCESLAMALRAWRFKDGIPKSLRNYVLKVKVMPEAAKRCAAKHGSKAGYGFVQVAVSPEVARLRVGNTDIGRARVFAAVPETYPVSGSAPGHSGASTSVTIESLQEASVRLALSPASAIEPAVMATGTSGMHAGASLASLRLPARLPRAGPAAPPSDAGGSAAGIGLLVSGALVLIGGGVVYGLAHAEADSIFDGFPSGADVTADNAAELDAEYGPIYQERADRIQLYEALGWAGLGVGAALLTTGAVLMALEPSETEVTPSVSTDGAHLLLRRRF